MISNQYLYDRLVAARHAEIRRDMQQSRNLARAGQRRTFAWSAVGRFGTWLGELGFRLQRTKQQSKASLS
jgi:hypothetical protein